jgi:hypothetical protein
MSGFSAWFAALQHGPGRLLAACLLGACAAGGLLPAAASGAEFITPPGLNVEAQESLLKERVTQLAQELVGDKLVDVTVSIGYLRTADASGGSRRIKLPGFNSFIQPGGQAGGQVVSGYTRLRQVLVTVSDTLESQPGALAEQIRERGGFDPGKGDLVRVVKLAAKPGAPTAGEARQPGEGESLEADAQALSERLRKNKARLAQQRQHDELGSVMAQDALAEAQSTTFLIRARAAFFNGDYNRALDQILQSLSQNPNNPQAYAMLGSLYFAVDWRNLALKYWEKSLELDPENPELQELVARVRLGPNS